MRALGFDVHKAEVMKLLREYDREEAAKMSFDNFYEVSECRHYCRQLSLQLSSDCHTWFPPDTVLARCHDAQCADDYVQ